MHLCRAAPGALAAAAARLRPPARHAAARRALAVTARQRTDKGEEAAKYTKSTLPSKVCAVCGRPFEWRRKWQKVWDEVRYCSERCRRQRGRSAGKGEEGQAE